MNVACVPDEHPYLTASIPDDVTRVAALGEGRWAPSRWLDVEFLAAHAREIDLVHLHFGFDHMTGAGLQRWVGALGALGTPLVLTVHDLRNPHHREPAEHEEHLRILTAAASAVLTLTSGAAHHLAERFGVAAIVAPHPALMRPGTAATERGLVGIHLKSGRTNVVDAASIVAGAAEGARQAGGRLRVDLHPDFGPTRELARIMRLARAGRCEVVVHERFSDLALAAYLQRLHASVLPNRFGSHSGWLEACRDVGTAVVAPSCGFYGDQWSEVAIYGNDERSGLDAASLEHAVAAVLATPPPQPADRGRQQQALHALHRQVYAAVCAPRAEAA